MHLGLTNNANGAGSGGAMTDAEFEAVLTAVIGNNASVASFLNTAAPTALAFLQTVGGANTRPFSNANAGDFTAVMGEANSRAQMLAILQDGAATNISVAGNGANRVIAQNVFINALNSIRAEQASVSNQKQNVVEATDGFKIYN